MRECPGVVSLLVHLHPVHFFPLLFLPLHSACLISFHMCDVPPEACSCWRLYHDLISCLTILCGVGWNDEENLSTLSCCMSTASPMSPFEYWACPFSSAYNFAFPFSFLITHLLCVTHRCLVTSQLVFRVKRNSAGLFPFRGTLYVLVNSHIFSQFVFPTQPFCFSNPDSLHQWWVLKLNFSIRLSPFCCCYFHNTPWKGQIWPEVHYLFCMWHVIHVCWRLTPDCQNYFLGCRRGQCIILILATVVIHYFKYGVIAWQWS